MPYHIFSMKQVHICLIFNALPHVTIMLLRKQFSRELQPILISMEEINIRDRGLKLQEIWNYFLSKYTSVTLCIIIIFQTI